MTAGAPSLRLHGVHVTYATSRGHVYAVRDVDLELGPGEIVALVGESGCGKSSLARAALMLRPPERGTIVLQGPRGPLPLHELPARALRQARRHVQIVFQDPYASLDPRRTVGSTVAEPLRAHGLVRRADEAARVSELLTRVGLDPSIASRYPHELSGGQRQRIGIARALAPKPSVLVLDEAVSSLDVSLRAQILGLLQEVRHDLHLAMLFITHDLAVVRSIADRVCVMYLGAIVEEGPRDRVLNSPAHPYTRALLDAVPVPDPDVQARDRPTTLPGDPPSPTTLQPGCPFASRCPVAEDRCTSEIPALRDIPGGGRSACHLS